jgi:1,2-diacylglycerol 3-beta-galactosyltransferase
MASRLLFLIADTGGAHRSFANAVAHHLAATRPGAFEVSVVDPFATEGPAATARATGLYGPLTVHAPWLWGGLWHSTNSRAMSRLIELALRSVDPSVTRWVRRVEPAAIVSFHPLLGHAAVRARRKLDVRPPVVSVVTDLVDVHALWACPEVELLIAPTTIAMDRCVRNGVPLDRLVHIGLPVDPAFTRPPPGHPERRERRHALGLPEDRFTVLLSGGADGSGGLERRARLLAASDLDLSLVVICGHNRRARRRLEGLTDRSGRPVRVLGFVDDMPEWMRVSDVAVTKAGAGTVAEALCSGLPMLIVWFIPGQERGNMEWVVAGGAGRYVPGDAELLREMAELSAPGSAALAEMRAAAFRLARPHATADVAAAICSMVPER